jgi:DNA-binding Lrp family transcriptional regulator
MTRDMPDHIDLLLLNLLQENMPLVPDPWGEIGTCIGIPGHEVLARVKTLADRGIIRQISPVLETGKRYAVVSTLVAIRVPGERIRETAAIISRYPEISHNFRRDHEYALWFTLAAPDTGRIEEIISSISAGAGIDPGDILDLRTIRRYKIHVLFPFLAGPGGEDDGPR